jgi:predicted signal transduction protein with EAL and GGDEF domain
VDAAAGSTNAPAELPKVDRSEAASVDLPLELDLMLDLDLDLDLDTAAPEAAPIVCTVEPTPAARVDLDLPLETVPAILWRSDFDDGPDLHPAPPPGTEALGAGGQAQVVAKAVGTAAAPAAARDDAPAAKPRWQGALDTTLAKAWAESERVALLRIASGRLDDVAAALGSAGEALARETFTQRLQALMKEPGLVEHLAGARLQALPDAHLIVLPGLRSASVAETLARRCIEALARPVVLGEHRLALPATVGISMFPHDGHQSPALLRTAEVAWRHACQRGRSGYQFYAQEMDVRSLRRLSLEAEFRDALVEGGVRLSYLPRIALSTGALCGAEVQLSWTARDGATLDTAGVLAFAEDTDQAEMLAHWLLTRACEQLRTWAAAGLGAPRLTLPVLPGALRRSYSVQGLHEILYDHAIGIGQVVLMLCPVQGDGCHPAEAAGALSVSRRQDVRDWALRLEPLRDAGFGLAIDAAASSACSLALLRHLPLSECRLDADVLDSLDDAQHSFARATIDLGHRLGLRVVASGVANEQQLARLRALGADDLQGAVISDALDGEIWAEVLLGARPLAHPAATAEDIQADASLPGTAKEVVAVASAAATSAPAEDAPTACDISLHLSNDVAA